ncbi:unnamed protein product [Closterium sp. NIES-54]
MAARVAPLGSTLSIRPSLSSRAASHCNCSRATLDRPHKTSLAVAVTAARNSACNGSSSNQRQNHHRNRNRHWHHHQQQPLLQLPAFFHCAPISPHGTGAILPARVIRTCARFPTVPAIAAAATGPVSPGASRGPQPPSATSGAAAPTATIAAAASAAASAAVEAAAGAIATAVAALDLEAQKAPQVAPKAPPTDSRNTITVRSPVGVDESPFLRARLTERPVPGQARWQPPAGQPSRCFLPRPLTYSSSIDDATICDVAVLPEYQQKGVGRRIVRKLIQDMQRRGPSGYAVFPPPLARRFFWMMGFRYERKYSLMAHHGQLMEPSPSDSTAAAPAVGAAAGSSAALSYSDRVDGGGGEVV